MHQSESSNDLDGPTDNRSSAIPRKELETWVTNAVPGLDLSGRVTLQNC